MRADIVHLNGVFLPLGEARVPVLDRGFIFGDGVYEFIPVYAGRPFRLDAHLARLEHSLAGIRLANPHDRAAWGELVAELVAQNGGGDLSVYLHITRGVAPRDHAFPAGVAPTVFMMALPLAPPPAELVETGVAAITGVDNRWQRCDLKTISLLANVLLRQQAVDTGAAEIILLRDGYLTEGSASNIFVVRAGRVAAPIRNHLVLPGITCEVVEELIAAEGLALERRDIGAAELAQADEIWLTSSPKEVLAITRLDGRAVGDGRPGPLFRRIHARYQDYKRSVMRAGPA